MKKKKTFFVEVEIINDKANWRKKQICLRKFEKESQVFCELCQCKKRVIDEICANQISFDFDEKQQQQQQKANENGEFEFLIQRVLSEENFARKKKKQTNKKFLSKVISLNVSKWNEMKQILTIIDGYMNTHIKSMQLMKVEAIKVHINETWDRDCFFSCAQDFVR